MIAVTCIVIGGLAATVLLRSRSASLRHWVLAVALACAAAAPALERIAPAWSLRGLAPARVATIAVPIVSISIPPATTPAPSVAAVERPAREWPVVRWLPRLWIAGTAISLFVLLVGFCRLTWIALHSTPVDGGAWRDCADAIARDYGLRRRVVLLRSPHPTLLVTWGWLRPKVILPSAVMDAQGDRVRVVLAHELAHVKRGDWVAQMLAELLRSAYWFNPLFWFASARLRVESEQACDDAVLDSGIAASAYAAELLELARAASRHRRQMLAGFPAPAMIRSSHLARRVTNMLNPGLNRRPPTNAIRVGTTLCALAFATLVVGLGAAAQAPARISGSVVDSMNAAMARLPVKATNVSTQAKVEAVTDATGHFSFAPLPAGEYVVEVSSPGFKALRMPVTLSGRDVERTLQLALGTLSETITVAFDPTRSAAAPPAPVVNRRAVPQPQECSASSGGGNIRPPMKLAHTQPVYPSSLVGSGVKGTVVLEARIGADGAVHDAKVIRSAHKDLDAAAIEAVRQWEFDATLLNCVTVDVAMTVTINFVEGQ